MAKKKEKVIDPLSKLSPQQLRCVLLYLGSENGISYGNATMSYFYAYNPEGTETKDREGKSTKQYETAKTEGSKLLAKPHIRAAKDYILVTQGYTPESIKKGIGELAHQRKNLPIALSAYDRMAKITGLLKEDNTVNIPALTELTENIKKILES